MAHSKIQLVLAHDSNWVNVCMDSPVGHYLNATEQADALIMILYSSVMAGTAEQVRNRLGIKIGDYNREIAAIEKKYEIPEWEDVDLDDMNPCFEYRIAYGSTLQRRARK